MQIKTQKALQTLLKVKTADLEQCLKERQEISLVIDMLHHEKELTQERLDKEKAFQSDPSATATLHHFAKACDDKIKAIDGEIASHLVALDKLQHTLLALHRTIKRFEFLLEKEALNRQKEAKKEEQKTLDEIALRRLRG